jgi:hypothetical protein
MMRRPRRSRLAEFLLWTAVALVTAVVLIVLSETTLPSNF